MSDIVKTIIRAETRKERLKIACEGFASISTATMAASSPVLFLLSFDGF